MVNEPEYLIQVNNVCKNYGEKTILQNINLNISKGQIITIIGPNGSGKSTLAKIISGILKPDIGAIINKNKLKIGYMPQKIHIDNVMPITVKEFLALNNQDGFNYALKYIKIKHLFNEMLFNLSGGELQRVLLAKSLMAKPELIILDEPTQGLDITGQIEFYNIIQELKNNENMAILLVSHDLHIVMKNTDYVICLNKHICCEGKTNQVILDKSYQELFNHKKLDPIAFYEHHHDHKHD